MERRGFLRSTGSLAVGCAVGAVAAGGCSGEEADPPPPYGTAEPPPPPPRASFGAVGIQLYTLRSLMERDLPGTLQQVATIGYEEVEFAGAFGYAPEELRGMLDALGIRAPAAHYGLADFRERLPEILRDAAVVGHQYLIAAWVDAEERERLDDYRRHAAEFNRWGARCRDAGLAFAYHNHDYELTSLEGARPLDVLLTETDPDLVSFELDFFWLRRGGADPLDYLRTHSGRFRLGHVKDMSEEGAMVDVGDGTIPFDLLIPAAAQAGMDHFFVEHDTPTDPLATAARSYAYLVGMEAAL